MTTFQFIWLTIGMPSILILVTYLWRVIDVYMRRKINIIERGKKEYKRLYIPVYGYFLQISRY